MSVKILGLNGSIRRLGNTEILLKEALSAAHADGADVDLACLHDFRIESCRGCLRCLLEQAECPVKDDLQALYDLWRSYDAVIVGAPNYINGLPAIFKQISDRSFCAFAHYPGLFSHAKASVFLTYMYDRFPYSLPLARLAMIVHGFRFDLIEGVALKADGIPGSVLNYPSSIETAVRMGEHLVKAVREETKPEHDFIDRCPDCLCDFFIRREDGTVQCPVCYRTGRIEDGKAVFRPEYNGISIISDRWREFEHSQISDRASVDRIRMVTKGRRRYKDSKTPHIHILTRRRTEDHTDGEGDGRGGGMKMNIRRDRE